MSETKLPSARLDATVEFTLAEVATNDGTVSLPSYSFTSDQDTGIYHPSSNNLAISTNGVMRWQIDQNGTLFAGTTQGIQFPVGSAAVPAMNFASDTDTGIFNNGANNIGFSTGGVEHLNISTTTMSSDLVLRIGNGSQTTPAYHFTAHTGSGLYTDASGFLNFSVNGTWVVGIDNTGVVLNGTTKFYNGDGTAALPSVTFINDTDTGIFRVGANNIGVATNGVKILDISTDTLRVQNDAGFISIFRPSNSRQGYMGMLNAFGGIRHHAGPNGGAELSTIAHQFTSDAPSAATTLMTILGGGDVSIGVDPAPAERLFIVGDASKNLLRLKSTNTTANTITALKIETGIASGGIGTGPFLHFADGGTDVFKILGAAGQVQTKPGSAATPAYSFLLDSNTGMYNPSTDAVAISVGGTATTQFDSSRLFTNVPIQVPDGSAALPAVTFLNDTNLGLYRIGTDEMGVSAAGGNLLFRFGFAGGLQTLFRGGTSAGLPGLALGEASGVGFYRVAGLDVMGVSAPMGFQSGTSSNPSVTFAGDENTGIYRFGIDAVSIAGGGSEYLRIGNTGAAGAIHSGVVGGFSNVINSAGSVAIYYAQNTDNSNGNSHAMVSLLTGGSTSGDPKIAFEVSAITGWSAGIDNSDSDIFVIDNSSTTLNAGGQFAITPNATAQVIGQDGTSALPYYSFYNDQDTGIYRFASNELSVALGGVERLRVSTSNSANDIRLLLWDHTANALVQVTRGAADSGGVGFRVLRVPN